MSVGVEVFTLIKKLFLVSDELTLPIAEVKATSSTVTNHEVRIAVIENTLTIARGSARLTLPGN